MDEVNEPDFTIEFNSDVIDPSTEADLFAEADTRLRQLANGHTDMVGAAITIREPAHGETSHLYEATVVVYVRPENVAAREKSDNPTFALKNALKAVERQIRERRQKLRAHWERPGQGPVDQEFIEITAAEAAVEEEIDREESS